jgi:hypothetical protein
MNIQLPAHGDDWHDLAAARRATLTLTATFLAAGCPSPASSVGRSADFHERDS